MATYSFKILFACVSLLITYQVKAQTISLPDTVKLEEFVVESGRQQLSTGNHIQTIDSLQLQDFQGSDLSEVLGQHVPVFLKTYGPGNISTPSFRGTSAAHTAVLWNGINIQNPLTGLADLALLPAFFTDEVQVQYGGSGALFGSGAVGGIIHLNNKARFTPGLQAIAFADFGSFNNFRQGIQLTAATAKWQSGIKVFNHFGGNNFPYQNTALPHQPEMRQSNAAVKQTGVLQENYLRLGKSNVLNLRLWYQDNFRQNPSTMLSFDSRSEISTMFTRLSAGWDNYSSKVNFSYRGAYLLDYLNYSDPRILLEAVHHNHGLVNEGEMNMNSGNKGRFSLGLNSYFYTGTSDHFSGKESEHRKSIFTAYTWKNDKWKLLGSLRQEFAGKKAVPLIPSLGAEWTAIPKLILKGNINRTYRLPSFNDLYWVPGGNRNLAPENGWSAEVAAILHKPFKGADKLGLTLFNSRVKNWIIWLPGTSLWTPENVLEVWSRGIEGSYLYSFEAGNIYWVLDASLNYVVATNEKALNNDDLSLHKQLIYVPSLNGLGGASASYKNYRLEYRQTYTGKRYTSSDNAYWLPAYSLGNISLSKNFSYRKFRGMIRVNVQNIYNSPYQVMLWRPMPGRSYYLSLSINFNHIKKS